MLPCLRWMWTRQTRREPLTVVSVGEFVAHSLFGCNGASQE